MKEVLTKEEKKGLVELGKYKKDNDVIIGNTDKSGKFFISSEDNYIKEVLKHVEGDEETEYKEVKEVESELNSETRHFKKMFRIGEDFPNQVKRMNSALLTNDCKPPPIVLLQKDHKKENSEGRKPGRPVCLAANTPNEVI